MKIDRHSSKNWQLTTLGAPRLENVGEHVKLSRRKSLAIFAYLAVRNRPCARETLANWFWPDLSERDGRTALRSSLSDLNRTLGAHWLIQNGDNLSISNDFVVEVDVFTLAQTVKNPSSITLEKLDKWQFDFLEGFHLEGCDVFEEWCYAQRQAAKNNLFQIMSWKLNQLVDSKSWSVVPELTSQWLAMDPLCEIPYVALMKMHKELGQTSQARLQFKHLTKCLEDELGVLPSAETKQLFLEIEKGTEQPKTQLSILEKSTELHMSDVAYARNGMVNIAYRQLGTAKSSLVIISGFISHLEQLLEEPRLTRFFTQLTQRFKIVVFDKRGMGLSDRIGHPPSVNETSNDVIAILDHAGIEKAWLLGISEGGPAAIQCAHDNASRVEALLLFGTTAKWTASKDYPHSLDRKQYYKWIDFLESSWGTAVNLEHFAPSCSDDELMVKWWKKMLRMSSSPGAIRAVLENAIDIDVRDCLSKIRQPALVVQQDEDQLVRAENGRYLASQLPNCDYLEVPAKDHWLWVTDTSTFFQTLDVFYKKHGFA